MADVIDQEVPRQCLQFFPQITGIQDTKRFYFSCEQVHILFRKVADLFL